MGRIQAPPNPPPRDTKISPFKIGLVLVTALLSIVTFYTQPSKPSASTLGSRVITGEILSEAAQTSAPRTYPARLLIPKLSIEANVQQVGLTSGGAMDVPTNSVDVGWFKEAAAPGETGSAVIDGHLDAKDGTAGVFQSLRSLQVGDKVQVRDSTGSVLSFIVWQKKEYDWDARPPEVFNKNDGKYLNLITCTGVWNIGKQSYAKRLVVFASLAQVLVN